MSIVDSVAQGKRRGSENSRSAVFPVSDNLGYVSNMNSFFAALNNNLDLEAAEILPNLLLSSQYVALDINVLLKYRITHILNAASYVENRFSHNFIYKRVNVIDLPSEDIKSYFEECCRFIHEARRSGGRVLVHCNAGVSRSVSFVCAYLVKYEKFSVINALAYIREKRPVARPNAGFIKQLMDYEVEIRNV
ncbi:dual specificity protein phosphatase 19 [Trichuris trichiura]|uniref:Dual specificity protein phosphatase 19 n=1 Tax=Trichuris trichiura TaxID=36087 RepID=A0A077Z934_TRITR|nr:dual specificity protein phosphatase 19 [Trichuris trichiura]